MLTWDEFGLAMIKIGMCYLAAVVISFAWVAHNL